MRRGRRLLKIFGYTVGTLAILLAAALVFIETGPGRRLLADTIGRVLSDGDTRIRVGAIEGSVYSRFTVARVALEDREGEWGRVEQVAIAWSPSRLLRGRIEIERIEIGRIAMARKPLPPSTAPPAPSPPAASTEPLADLPKVAVGRLTVADISLAAPVLGEAARLAVAGALNMRDPATGFAAQLDLRRTDGTPGALRLDAAYEPAAKRLKLHLDADEAAGGVVARLAGITDLPPLRVRLRGDGPLAQWDAVLEIDAAAQRVLDAKASLRAQKGGHVLALDLKAPASNLVPDPYRAALDAGIAAQMEMRVEDGKDIELRRLNIAAAGIALDASGRLAAGLETISLRFALQAADARVARSLAVPLDWRSLAVRGSIEGAVAAPVVAVDLDIAELRFRDIQAAAVTAALRAQPRDASRKSAPLDFTLTGRLDGAATTDRRFANLVEPRIEWQAAGTLDETGAAALRSARIVGGPAEIGFAGTLGPQAIDGRLSLSRVDLARASVLAGQTLAGIVNLRADIRGTPQGDFALKLDGDMEGAAFGVPVLDGLLAGKTTVAGGVSRAADGRFGVDDFVLRGPHLVVTARGTAAPAQANVEARVELPDLARADPRLSGSAVVSAALTGSLDRPDIAATIDVPSAAALGRRLERFGVNVTVKDAVGRPEGTIAASGTLDGKPIAGKGALATEANGDRVLRALDFAVASVRLTGDVRVDPRFLVQGHLDLKAGNLADLSAFALTELAGKIEASMRFSVEGSATQRIAIEASATGVAAGPARVESARITVSAARPADAAGLAGAVVDAAIELRGAVASGTVIPSARVTVKGPASALDLALEGAALGVTASAAAQLDLESETRKIRLDRFRLARGGRDVRLASPATITLAPNAIAVGRVVLASGSGTVAVQGNLADTIDLGIEIRALPLAVAALAMPDFAGQGDISGDIRISGPTGDPVARYDIAVARLSAAELRTLGAGPFAVQARGTVSAQRAQINATVTGPSQMALAIDGTVPLGGGLALTLRGKADLAMANAMLSAQGARVAGPVAVDLALSGSAAAPRISGTVRLTGGRYEDPVNGLYFDRLEVVATGDNDALTISRLAAVTRNGGAVTGSGRIAIDPAGGFPGRIEIRAANALLVQSDIVNSIADARIDISGALAQRPRIAGRIDIKNLEITIPEKLPGAASMIRVRHVNVSPGMKPYLPTPPAVPAGPAFAADMDLTVSAPVRVFVRGQGLDSELGGELRLRGTSEAPVLGGGFEMKRGRLSLLGKTLPITRGRVTFPGGLDPAIDFVSESPADDVVATVTVTGRASDPKFVFGSTPTLPQDEVLARLLFGRPTSRLTTSQAVQLAQIAAQLSGTGGPGVLDRLRRGLGVDTLEVGADAAGTGPQVGMGRRINDRIYVGVRQGATADSSRVTVNIDITRNVKIQTEMGADRSTSVGIGAEWNY